MTPLPTKLIVLHILPFCDTETLEAVQCLNKYYYNVVQPLLQRQYELSTIQRDSDKHARDIAVHDYNNEYDKAYEATLQSGFNDAFRDITCSQYPRLFKQHVEQYLQQYNEQYGTQHQLSQLIDRDKAAYDELSTLFVRDNSTSVSDTQD